MTDAIPPLSGQLAQRPGTAPIGGSTAPVGAEPSPNPIQKKRRGPCKISTKESKKATRSTWTVTLRSRRGYGGAVPPREHAEVVYPADWETPNCVVVHTNLGSYGVPPDHS